MVNLQTNQIILDGKAHPVLSYEVWWKVPFVGLFKNREEALKDFDAIVPIPVAVAEDTYETLE